MYSKPIILILCFLLLSPFIAISQNSLYWRTNVAAGFGNSQIAELRFSVGDLLSTTNQLQLVVFPILTTDNDVVTAVGFEAVRKLVDVYPNPCADRLNVSSSDLFGTFILVDLLGRAVIEGNWPVEIPVQQLAAGQYTLQLHTGLEVIAHKIVIKR
jgi:hypothetical protein